MTRGGHVGRAFDFGTERVRRVYPYRRSGTGVERDRIIDRRIQGAGRDAVDDDHVAPRLHAECHSPFDLIATMHIDIRINDDHRLGPRIS
jgi:hypothetical protein